MHSRGAPTTNQQTGSPVNAILLGIRDQYGLVAIRGGGAPGAPERVGTCSAHVRHRDQEMSFRKTIRPVMGLPPPDKSAPLTSVIFNVGD